MMKLDPTKTMKAHELGNGLDHGPAAPSSGPMVAQLV
jgi:hypothetical protein